ncbi:MAG: 2-O-methyltransferase NoeI [Chlamydiae bacterium]|nr:2-O-methyltransferase NoeI [Chlamydiota bacterium]
MHRNNIANMKHIFRLLGLFFCFCSQLFSNVKIIDFNSETTEILKIAKSHLPSDPIVFEAGAYNGSDTMKIASFFPEGKIYTFEPIAENFTEVLRATKSYKNIYPSQLALSNENGKAVFYVSEYVSSPKFLCGSSSLLPPKEHLKYDHNIIFSRAINVNTITIDWFAQSLGIDHIDFIWFDLQGFELNTLKASALAQEARVIYSEVEFIEAYEGQYLYEDLKKWLQENNFEIIAADFDENLILKCLEKGRYYGNIIFVKKN